MPELIDSHEKQSASVARILAALRERKMDFAVVTSNMKDPGQWEDFAKHGKYCTTDSTLKSVEDTYTRWANEVCLEWEPKFEAEQPGDDEEGYWAPESHSSLVGNDLCISAGGDGTFLMASLHNPGRVPVMGVNTSPGGSVGRLCCCTSEEVGALLDCLQRGEFEWVRRTRIGINVRPAGSKSAGRTLVQTALNEVFVGEKDPCRASVIRVHDGRVWEQFKCSGLIISTATGATAWTAGASRIEPRDVVAVMSSLERLHGPALPFNEMLKQGLDVGKVASAASDLITEQILAAGPDAMHMLAREALCRPGSDRLPFYYQGPSPLEAKSIPPPQGGASRPVFSSTFEAGRKLTVVSLASQQSETVMVLDGRVRVPLRRGMEAILQARPDRVLWTFAWDKAKPAGK